MFSKVVELYRKLGKPEWSFECSFEVRVPRTDQILELLKYCKNLDECFGGFHYQIDKNDVIVEVELPGNENFRVFKDIEEFVKNTSSLLVGDFRDGVYIRDIDYCSADLQIPIQIKNLKRNVAFVKSLRSFSSLNADLGEALAINKLIFLRSPDGKSPKTSAVAPLSINSNFADFEVSSYAILDAIIKASNTSEKLHVEERILILNSAIADVLSDAPEKSESLEYLARNWKSVTTKYFHDFQGYINNFAFDSVRKKLAESAIESSSKIAGALNDITTKLIAIPVSLAAIIALRGVDTVVAFVVGALGIVVGSIIWLVLIKHYKDQTSNLIEIFNFSFATYTKKISTFPSGMQKEIRRINDEIEKQKKKLKKLVRLFAILVATPTVAILLVAYEKYHELIEMSFYIWKYCIA